MAVNFSAEQVFDPKAIWSKSRVESRGVSHSSFEYSKWMLVANDILLSAAAWFFCAWALAAHPFEQGGLMPSVGALLVYAGMTVGLFSSQELYSRHSRDLSATGIQVFRF